MYDWVSHFEGVNVGVVDKQEKMSSWFDSSFSFARSALSQAQKSIDRVLDISENTDGNEHSNQSGMSIKEKYILLNEVLSRL